VQKPGEEMIALTIQADHEAAARQKAEGMGFVVHELQSKPVVVLQVEKFGEGRCAIEIDGSDELAARRQAEAMGYTVLKVLEVRNPDKPVPARPLALQNPPRTVPLVVYLSNLCGGFANQFGWVWIGFTLCFVWGFGVPSYLLSLYEFSGTLDHARAVVTATEAANFKVNDSDMYATHFVLAGSGGGRYEGVSYSFSKGPEQGAAVTVEYPSGNPASARIKGMGYSRLAFVGEMMGWLALVFLTPFMGIGIVFLFFGLRTGIRANRLLANGRGAYGRLKSSEPTSTRINNQRVMKLTFAFTTEDGQPAEAVLRTPQTGPVTDEPAEKLIYDPRNPSRAVLLDSLPSGAAIDDHGQIYSRRPIRAAVSLILPCLVVAVHASVAWYLFFS
jgi:hypothetical protein